MVGVFFFVWWVGGGGGGGGGGAPPPPPKITVLIDSMLLRRRFGVCMRVCVSGRVCWCELATALSVARWFAFRFDNGAAGLRSSVAAGEIFGSLLSPSSAQVALHRLTVVLVFGNCCSQSVGRLRMSWCRMCCVARSFLFCLAFYGGAGLRRTGRQRGSLTVLLSPLLVAPHCLRALSVVCGRVCW